MYADNGPCCSSHSQTWCISGQSLNMALGHYETDDILRATAEQVCELRDGSSKNYCDVVLRQTSSRTKSTAHFTVAWTCFGSITQLQSHLFFKQQQQNRTIVTVKSGIFVPFSKVCLMQKNVSLKEYVISM